MTDDDECFEDMLYNEIPPINYYPNGTIGWTPREDQRLFNSYGVANKEGLLLLFPDRTFNAVVKRAYLLKHPKRRRHYTKEETELLTKLHEQGLTYKEMTPFFTNRVPVALKSKIYRLKRTTK